MNSTVPADLCYKTLKCWQAGVTYHGVMHAHDKVSNYGE